MKIALINMPFGFVMFPSIQLGLLKSVLKDKGYVVDDYYLNIFFAKKLGLTFYDTLMRSDMKFCEWIFSNEAFGLDNYSILNRKKNSLCDCFSLTGQNEYDEFIKKIQSIRENLIPEWFNELVNMIDWSKYNVIGFTASFAQLVPSIAFSKRLKQINPNLTIVIGGSAVSGTMGEVVAQMVPEIDIIVDSEGENAIIEIIEKLKKNNIKSKIYKSKKLTNLNELPLPDYDTYYEVLENNLGEDNKGIDYLGCLIYQTSRGCWWGEKKNCKFCSFKLNESNDYKYLNYEIALNNIIELSNKYNILIFQMADHIIPPAYINTLCRELKKYDYTIFYEVRSNLTFKQLKILKEAGITLIQAGIESLNTGLLRLLNKGINASHNINLLRNSKILNIHVTWNFLYRIPFENEEQYLNMIDLIPKIHHLQPPQSFRPIEIFRCSPFFNDYKLYFHDIAPHEDYYDIYPKNWDLKKLAFYFQGIPISSVSKKIYLKLSIAIKKWQYLYECKTKYPTLIFKKSRKFAFIFDSRNSKSKKIKITGDFLDVAILLNNKNLSLVALKKVTTISQNKLEKICDYFLKISCTVELDNKYIWLPITSNSFDYHTLH